MGQQQMISPLSKPPLQQPWTSSILLEETSIRSRQQIEIYSRHRSTVEGNILIALALSLFAGLATGIGSLISYFIPRPDMRYLSLSLGFAAGVMVYVGFVDLFCSSRIVLGFGYAADLSA